MPQEKFLQIEKAVQGLLETLSSLKDEAVSYKTSTGELDTARIKLVGLIDAIQIVTTDSHQVIKFIKDIGGPEILRLMNKSSKIIEDESRMNIKRFKNLEDESQIYIKQFKNLKVFSVLLISTNILTLIILAILLIR
jgi:hypothetical protein